MLALELPWPPSVNHYWRHVGPRTLISREGRRYREHVVAILAARRIAPMVGALEIDIDAFPPDKRRRDADNLLKAILDSVERGAAYHDDSQIIRLQIFKRHPVDGGKVIVRIIQSPHEHEPHLYPVRAAASRSL